MKNRKREIILLRDNNWRLANLLRWYAALLCLGKEMGYAVYNPSFFEFIEKFPELKEQNKKYAILFSFLRKIKNRKIRKGIYLMVSYIVMPIIFIMRWKYIKKKIATLFEKDSIQTLKKRSKIFFDGRFFVKQELFEKYHACIKEKFVPNLDIQKTIQKKMKKYRTEYDKIIWVHIRRGDYRTRNEGKFFVDDITAYARLLEIKKQYLKQKILFLVCSDEIIDVNKYLNIDIIQNDWSFVEDLYILAETDMIVWSDSTFGRWAAYYGGIDILSFVENNNLNIYDGLYNATYF